MPDDAIASLQKHDYAVVPNFLTPPQVDVIIEHIASCRQPDSSTPFAVAGIGQDSTNQVRKWGDDALGGVVDATSNADKLDDSKVDSTIRKTETLFIYPKLPPSPALSDLLYPCLESMADRLGSSFGTKMDKGLTEALYAYYPNGGFYRRHVDALPGSASALREFSFLLYLNKAWTPEDGGCLRLYTGGRQGGEGGGEGGAVHEDVQPTAGKLVVFKSDRLPHEVLETSAERLAVVGWFNRAVSPADIAALGGGDLLKKAPLLIASAALIGIGLSMLN